MNALSAPTPAPSRRSLFPEHITAGRARTAADLHRHAARIGDVDTLVQTIRAVDAALSPDAPPFSSQARHLARLAQQIAERMRLARALRSLAVLHQACDVPAPLFGLCTARQVSVLLATDPAAAELLVPLGPALAWTRTTGVRRAAAVRQMAALLGRLGVHRPFPLPEAVARNLPAPWLAGDDAGTAGMAEAAERGDRRPCAPPCPRTADRLDALAGRLEADIHRKRHLHADQTLTPRRARVRAAGQRVADALEPLRDALRALAAAARTGTLPATLEGVTTRAAAEHLVAQVPGDVPAYPETDSAHARATRGRLRRAGVRDADDFDAAVRALAALARPGDARPAADREAARIRSLIEAARLSGIPDYFFSPPVVTDAILSAAALPDEPGPAFRVLDPSAGDGALLDAARARLSRASLVAVEVNARLREVLGAKGYALAGTDALAFEDAEGFDRILMNPPFGCGGSLAMPHVRHAYGLLRPGGRLVAVVPDSCFFRADRAHRDFRVWVEALGGFDLSLPYEAFAAAGTSVSARLLVLDCP